MIRVKKIPVEPCYSQVLDEVVLAGTVGNEASVGENPSPEEGVITRPINQEDVKVMAARLAENKKNAQDAQNAQNAEVDPAVLNERSGSRRERSQAGQTSRGSKRSTSTWSMNTC